MIPKLHYISTGQTSKEQLENIQKACTSGIELVRVQLPSGSNKKRLAFAREVHKITAHFQTRLLLIDDYKIAKEIQADGIHLTKKTLSPTTIRQHLDSWHIIGATAYTEDDCKALVLEQVDYISLEPFTSSQDEQFPAPLGIPGCTRIATSLQTKIPLLVSGGITLADVASILETGITGLAIARAITNDFNSIRAFNKLLQASVTQEQRHTFKRDL